MSGQAIMAKFTIFFKFFKRTQPTTALGLQTEITDKNNAKPFGDEQGFYEEQIKLMKNRTNNNAKVWENQKIRNSTHLY